MTVCSVEQTVIFILFSVRGIVRHIPEGGRAWACPRRGGPQWPSRHTPYPRPAGAVLTSPPGWSGP